MALEIHRDRWAAWAVDRIPRDLSAGLALEIHRDRWAVWAADRIPPARSAESASGAAMASGCCASRGRWRDLRLSLTYDFGIGSPVRVAYPKVEEDSYDTGNGQTPLDQ